MKPSFALKIYLDDITEVSVKRVLVNGEFSDIENHLKAFYPTATHIQCILVVAYGYINVNAPSVQEITPNEFKYILEEMGV